MSSPPKERTLE
jgi:hypothetical protein